MIPCLQSNVYHPPALFCTSPSTLPNNPNPSDYCSPTYTPVLTVEHLSHWLSVHSLLFTTLLVSPFLSYSIHASKQLDFFSLLFRANSCRASEPTIKQLVPRLSGTAEFDSTKIVLTMKLRHLTFTVLFYDIFFLKTLPSDHLPPHNFNYHSQNCFYFLLNLPPPLTSRDNYFLTEGELIYKSICVGLLLRSKRHLGSFDAILIGNNTTLCSYN